MNKKLILVGLLVAGAVIAVKANSKSSTAGGSNAIDGGRGFSATFPNAPNGATWLILNGKKYPFVSEQAFRNFGYTQPQMLTEQDVTAYADGGFVGDDGRVWDSVANAVILGNAQD